jgi:hypothetical protein
MTPMGLNFTQFITLREIEVKDIDLFEDAYGINAEFNDVIALLRQLNPVPERCLTTSLINKVRKIV